jgi:predicted aconitase with swiveling domain
MTKGRTKSKIQFAVITEIPKDNDGNYACGEILIVPGGRHNIVGSNIIVDPPCV